MDYISPFITRSEDGLNVRVGIASRFHGHYAEMNADTLELVSEFRGRNSVPTDNGTYYHDGGHILAFDSKDGSRKQFHIPVDELNGVAYYLAVTNEEPRPSDWYQKRRVAYRDYDNVMSKIYEQPVT